MRLLNDAVYQAKIAPHRRRLRTAEAWRCVVGSLATALVLLFVSTLYFASALPSNDNGHLLPPSGSSSVAFLSPRQQQQQQQQLASTAATTTSNDSGQQQPVSSTTTTERTQVIAAAARGESPHGGILTSVLPRRESIEQGIKDNIEPDAVQPLPNAADSSHQQQQQQLAQHVGDSGGRMDAIKPSVTSDNGIPDAAAQQTARRLAKGNRLADTSSEDGNSQASSQLAEAGAHSDEAGSLPSIEQLAESEGVAVGYEIE